MNDGLTDGGCGGQTDGRIGLSLSRHTIGRIYGYKDTDFTVCLDN